MSKTITTVLSLQDEISNKLAGISGKTKGLINDFKNVGTAIDTAFRSSVAESSMSRLQSTVSNSTRNIASTAKTNIDTAIQSIESSFDKVSDSAGEAFEDVGKEIEDSLPKAFDKASESLENFLDSVDKIGNDVNGLGKDFDSLGRRIPSVSDGIRGFGNNSRQAGTEIGSLETRSNSLSGTLQKLFAVIADGTAINKLKEFGKESFNEYVNFDSGMGEVSTMLPDISENGMAALTKETREFSKDMGVLTKESVPALYQALSAGVSRDSVFDFLGTSQKAAVGGVADLETAVDGLSSVVNAYGPDALNAGTASDLMFTTIRLGKTNFQQLAGSLYNVVPTAVGAGVAFQDVSAALAAMTAQGVPTSVATTQLRQAIVELSSSGTDTDETFRKIAGKGFKDFIAQGGNLQSALQLLEKHAKESNLGINDLFGSVEAGNAALSLTGTGTDKFTSSMQEMQNAAGATDAAYDKMSDTLQHKIDLLSASWEDVKLTAGESLGEALEPAIESLYENMDLIKEPLSEIFKTIGQGISEIAPLLPSILEGLNEGLKTLGSVALPVLNFLKSNPKLITSFIGGIGGSIATYKIGTGLTDLAGGLGKLGTMLMKHPWAAGAAAVVGGLTLIIGAVKNYNEQLANESLAEHFGNVTLAADDLEQAANKILGLKFGKMDKVLDAVELAESLRESVNQGIAEIERMNWKVKLGLKLSTSEIGDYQATIDKFIEDTQAQLTNEQFAVTTSLEISLKGVEDGKDFITGIQDLFKKDQEKLKIYGDHLGETVMKYMADGVLDADEAKVVSALQQKMQEITEALNEAKYDAKLDMLEIEFAGAELSPESYAQLVEKLKKQREEYVESTSVTMEEAIAGARYMYNNGGISEEEFNNKKKEIQNGRYIDIGNRELKDANFQLNTIEDIYSDQINNAAPQISKMADDVLGNALSSLNVEGTNINELFTGMMTQLQSGAEGATDPKARAAMANLYGQMMPTMDDLEGSVEQFKKNGIAIPKEMANGLSQAFTDANTLGAVTGDAGALWNTLANAIVDNPEYMSAIESAKDRGVQFPQAFEDAFSKATEGLGVEIETPVDVKSEVKNIDNKSVEEAFRNKVRKVDPVEETADVNVTGEVNNVNNDSVEQAISEIEQDPVQAEKKVDVSLTTEEMDTSAVTESASNLGDETVNAATTALTNSGEAINAAAALSTAIAGAIDGSVGAATTAASSMGLNVLNALSSALKVGVSVSIPVAISVNYSISGDRLGLLSGGSVGSGSFSIVKHALGGIFDSPHIGMVAEAGPEAIIPLDGSDNALELWQQAGEMLGMFSDKPLNVEPNMDMADTGASRLDTHTSSDKNINLNINGSGKIQVGGGVSKDKVLEIIYSNIKDVILDIIDQETLEEGDMAYEY